MVPSGAAVRLCSELTRAMKPGHHPVVPSSGHAGRSRYSGARGHNQSVLRPDTVAVYVAPGRAERRSAGTYISLSGAIAAMGHPAPISAPPPQIQIKAAITTCRAT